jgi:PleD family two-component response regulator
MKKEDKNKIKKPKKATKKTSKSKTIAEMTIDQIKAEMESMAHQINQGKAEIEKLADEVIGELSKLGEYRKEIEDQTETNDSKKTSSQTKGSKRKKGKKKEAVDLDYELANMKMIKKLLDISDHLAHKREAVDSNLRKKRSFLARKRAKKLRIEEAKNGRPKVLIIEDDNTTANIITYVLTKHNYHISATANAEEGLKMTLKEKPSLIILDIMLPGMDGFQLLSILKENEETAHIPVVLISSLAGEQDILKGLEIGAEDYILKPFSPQVLHLKVKKLMGKRNEHIAPHHRL